MRKENAYNDRRIGRNSIIIRNIQSLFCVLYRNASCSYLWFLSCLWCLSICDSYVLVLPKFLFFVLSFCFVDLKWYVTVDPLAFNCPLNVLTFQRKEKENKKQKTKRNGLTSTLSLSYVISLCNVFVSPSNFFEASQDGAIPNKRQTASMTIVISRGGFTKAFISLKCRFNCYKINVSNVNLDLQNKGI